MDIEKAFDSLSHSFLILVLKRFGFGEKFIDWVNILLKDQESCIINGGHTTKYFKLEKGARQGDPISAYLFILALEVLFILIKSEKNIEGLNLFNHTFLYTAYADDTSFFLKDITSVKNVLKIFSVFYSYSGLRPNLSKCEIAGIGVLKGVTVALCGMKCIDLTKNSIKILGIHFSYNKKFQDDMNFCDTIKNISNVTKLWRMQNLSLEGKITVFKTLAVSKIVYLALLTTVPTMVIDELNLIQNKFLWDNKKPKIKKETLCSDFKDGGLKSVNILHKIASLKCSWIKRLCDDNFHEWKVIPKYYINKALGYNIKFHSNMLLPDNVLNLLPSFYKGLFSNWCKYYSTEPLIPSTIGSQNLWFNRFIKIDHKVIFLKEFSEKNFNFLIQLFDEKGRLKKWENIKHEYKISPKMHFKWLQILHAIPSVWKKKMILDKGNCKNLVYLDNHLTTNNQIYSCQKLNAKDLYFHSIRLINSKPTSQVYFQKLFQEIELDWKNIYLLPRIVTIDVKLRNFQYKILNNILYLNKKLFLFGMHQTPLCSFCNYADETPIHLFSECRISTKLWLDISNHFEQNINFPSLTPQSAIFGFLDLNDNIHLLTNHILLIFKYYIYTSRQLKTLSLEIFLQKIKNIYAIEKKISEHTLKRKSFSKKNGKKFNKIFDKFSN